MQPSIFINVRLVSSDWLIFTLHIKTYIRLSKVDCPLLHVLQLLIHYQSCYYGKAVLNSTGYDPICYYCASDEMCNNS